MTTISRLTVWTTGDVLTAAAQNNEFNNIINDYNGSIDEDNIGTLAGTITWNVAGNSDCLSVTKAGAGVGSVLDCTNAGTDPTIKSNNTSTGHHIELSDAGAVSFIVAETGIIETAGSLTPGWTSNLGIDYNVLTANTFAICDAGGTALSASNPGWVTLPSVTAGRVVTLKVTDATHVFIDDTGVSNLTNLGFGITEAADWANDMPWFLYAVNEDDTNAGLGFFISRSPCLSVTPAANYIHDYTAAAANDSERSIFGMWNDDAGKAAKPCAVIGAFRMRWSTTSDDWTVQTLGNNDGIGYHKVVSTCSAVYTMPQNQNGATAGGFLNDNGGTAPIFTTNSYTYSVGLDGFIKIQFYLNADGGADGAGAVNTEMALPAVINASVPNASESMIRLQSSNFGSTIASAQFSPDSRKITFLCVDNIGIALQASMIQVLNSHFAAGARTLSGMITYKAF